MQHPPQRTPWDLQGRSARPAEPPAAYRSPAAEVRRTLNFMVERHRLEAEPAGRLNLEQALVVALIFVVFTIRAAGITAYNTLFVDEAIYAVVGEDALHGVYDTNASSWLFGSYLYPVAVSLADSLAGVTGMRILSAVLSTASAVCVYFAAKWLFDRTTAVWALVLFGLAGPSISLGQLAVYDAPGAAFLSLAFCLVVVGALIPGTRSRRSLLLLGALAATLSVLSKYIGIALVPVLGGLAWLLQIARSRRAIPAMWDVALFFALPSVLLLGGYLALYFDDVRIVFTGVNSTQVVARADILRAIWDEIGLHLLLALAGVASALIKRPHRDEGTSAWLLVYPALAASGLVLLAYHYASANYRSLIKHTVYALIFLAPLGAYFFTSAIRLVASPSRRARPLRLVWSGIILALLFVLFESALVRNWVYQQSWPNAGGVVEFLRDDGFGRDNRVLASASQIYEYYFDFGTGDRAMWHNPWFVLYGGLSGIDAMAAAVEDYQYDYVILDTFYTPDVATALAPVLDEANYTLVYEDLQNIISDAPVEIRVYAAPRDWPTFDSVSEFLLAQGVSEQSAVLASGPDMYVDLIPYSDTWHDTWDMQYGAASGVEAMQAAIRDTYFDFVVLNNLFAEEVNPLLEQALTSAGYERVYEEEQTIRGRSEPITVHVYMPAADTPEQPGTEVGQP